MGESRKINAGAWRKHIDPMQIISGAIGKEKIHFEAPSSSHVPDEMKKFIKWFNETAPGGKNEIKKAPVRSAIAHLYFETIHPFEDGNGRIGRAIAEKALSQTIGRPVLLSLSRTIEAKKKLYYNALEQAQNSNDITQWINYFVNTILEAQIQEKQFIDFILKKSKFFDRFKQVLNEQCTYEFKAGLVLETLSRYYPTTIDEKTKVHFFLKHTPINCNISHCDIVIQNTPEGITKNLKRDIRAFLATFFN